jgi:AcrR family transcriptional regulator
VSLDRQPGSRAASTTRGQDATPRSRRRTQAERSATTRTAILQAARELFGRRGYAATGRDEIAARAGVTRGALYHHFASKAEVFAAVAEALDEEFVELVRSAAGSGASGSALEALDRAAQAYVRACADPDVGRIVIDAPSVLGPEAHRAMNARACQELLVPAISAIAAEGGRVPGDPEVLAPLLLALLDEAGSAVGADPDRTADVTATVSEVVARLFSA